MNRSKASLLAVAVVLAAGAALYAAEAMHPGHIALNAAELAWGPAPPKLPPGAQIAVLAGDPGSEGAYVMRAKFPKGYKVPPHWHPTRENVTVISGSISIGAGEKFDAAAGKKVTAGGFISLPALMAHFAWTDEETEIQIHGLGPFALFYVDPADDPTKKAKP